MRRWEDYVLWSTWLLSVAACVGQHVGQYFLRFGTTAVAAGVVVCAADRFMPGSAVLSIHMLYILALAFIHASWNSAWVSRRL